MKHNKYPLSFLLACFATAASLAGCTWDSSLYDDFVNKNTDSAMKCEGRLGITLPNGVYAYYDKDINKYYCGTYDELKKTLTTCQQYIENILNIDDPEGKKIKEFGFSSFEEFEAYFEKITRFDDLCPTNTESCFKLEIQPSVITILCNACPEGTAKIKKDSKIECSRCPIEEHYVQETKMCEKDDEENCGEYGYACKDYVAGWKNGECKQGKCFATSCEIGYDLNNEGICEARTSCTDPNTHYYNGACIKNNLDNCGKHNNKCSDITGWSQAEECLDDNDKLENACGACINGVCVPSKCQIGYHLDEGSCVADDNKTCGPQKESCGQGQVCTQGTCSDNCGTGEVRCEKGGVVSCADPNTSTTYCGADESCSGYKTCEHGQACIAGKCEQNSCTNDNETLCVVNGENMCIDISSDNADHCGACNLKCSALLGWEAGECKAGKCVASECKQDFCIDKNGTCVDGRYNSLTCGANGDTQQCTDCTTSTTNTTKTQVCVMGICRPSECEDNTCFYQSNQGTTCSNTAEHCGKDCVNCNTADNASAGTCNVDTGTCTITNCARGYHKSNTKCVENSNTQCAPTTGGTVKDCTKDDHATSGICNAEGKCVATSCEPGYHVVNDACVEDSDTACGASATDCTMLDGWLSGKCNQGSCNAILCRDGYCLNGTTCVNGAYNSTMCGTTGNKCTDCNDGSFTDANLNTTACDAGQCIIDTCITGYHVVDQGQSCEEDLPTACGQPPQNCTELPGWKEANCQRGKCVALLCEDTHFLQGDQCMPDPATSCGGIDCNEIDHVKHALCDRNMCYVAKCEDGYIANNSTGSHGTCDCNDSVCNITTFAHAKSASCNQTARHCAVVCESGYTRDGEDGQCVCDSISCISTTFGSYVQEAKCNEATMTCDITCQDGYALENNACVCDETKCAPPSPSLNITMRSCQTDGSCEVTECQSGYHISTDRLSCVANTNTACAPVGSSDAVSCANPNPKCGDNGICCRENTSNTTNTKPNCCSGYTCIQNEESDPIQYKCVSGNISEASWSLCSP